MRLFRTKREPVSGLPQNSDVETIRNKLAAVEAEITQASAELNRLALQAVLDGDNSATEATARLDELRQRRDLLTRALSAVEENERAKREALNAREWQARRRALSQHAGRLQRDAHDVSAALADLHEALGGLSASGAAITALLPPSMLTPARPFYEMFSAGFLRSLTDVEAWRLSPNDHKRPARLAMYEDQRTGQVQPLAAIVADLVATVRREFDQTAPLVPADKPAAERAHKPQPEPVEEVRADKPQTPLPGVASPASSAPVIVDVPPSAPAIAGSDRPAPQFSGVKVDLRRNAGERFTDLRDPVVWPVSEPETEEASTSELQDAGPIPPGC